MEITISAPNCQWPEQFEAIKAELAGDLADDGVPYLSIEHIGSTSIPHLPAKPIIDILITVTPTEFTTTTLEKCKEILSWGPRQGGYHYIGSGGVQGRWSFKLYGDIEPARNVYVMPEDGRLMVTSYRVLRETLLVDEKLREEYGRIKCELAEGQYGDIMQYAAKKRPTIRKILKRGGWTDGMVDEQEGMSVVGWASEAGDYY